MSIVRRRIALAPDAFEISQICCLRSTSCHGTLIEAWPVIRILPYSSTFYVVMLSDRGLRAIANIRLLRLSSSPARSPSELRPGMLRAGRADTPGGDFTRRRAVMRATQLAGAPRGSARPRGGRGRRPSRPSPGVRDEALDPPIAGPSGERSTSFSASIWRAPRSRARRSGSRRSGAVVAGPRSPRRFGREEGGDREAVRRGPFERHDSGTDALCSSANMRPVRPKPVCTSSKISSAPAAGVRRRSASK